MPLKQGSSVFLDLLRLLASQLVVFGHAISYFGIFTFLHEPRFPWLQNIAVLVFFLLSGFVISYSISEKQARSPGYGFTDYFADRFARIFSAFVPALVFVLALDVLSAWLRPEAYRFAGALDAPTFFANLVMLQDFPYWSLLTESCCTSFGSARPFWSVAIEWWLYMFFGFVVLVLARQPSPRNIAITLLLAPVPFYNLVGGRGNGLTACWMMGAMVCFLLAEGRIFRIAAGAKAAILVMALLAAWVRISAIGMRVYDPLVALALAIAFAYALDLFSEVNFSDHATRLIRLGAGFSFTLYLVHYSILDFLFVHFGMLDPYALLIAGIVVANLLSYGIGLFTEQRLTRYVRDALRKAGRKSVPALLKVE